MSNSSEATANNVTTVKEILNFDGSDEVKFDLLARLVREKRASAKDVVTAIPYLLEGGEFGDRNFIIQDSKNILHLLKLVSSCPLSLQAEVWSVFITVLKKSQWNLYACTEVSLITHALALLSDADETIADKLSEMLGILASYSIAAQELKAVLALLEARNSVWHRHSTRLISVLRHMPQRQGPDEFFSFPGKKGSHIALPPIKSWPYHSGWTYLCWIRFDPTTGSSSDRQKPYLYCFRTSKGIGYTAHFAGGSLVITAMKMKGKGFQHSVKYDFQPRQWYMVALVHVHNRWSKSEIRCYVDGQLVSSGDMSWLVSTSDPFDKCYIGSSIDGDPEEMFSGQMSAVYLFNEAFSLQQISDIYHIGPGYKVFSDAKLASSVVFIYSPVACDGQLCLESSPKGNQSYFLHSPHAMMCQDIKAVIRHSVYSSLHSLGGIEVLFPLFGQLDMPVDSGPNKSMEIDHTICASLIGLIGDLIQHSHSIQQQMVQSSGFVVISYFLEKSSREHITPAVVESLLRLIEFMVGIPEGQKLVGHIFDSILFNPQLWVHTTVEVQTKLYCYFATEFISNPLIYNSIQRVNVVLHIMHSLKYYYWVVNPLDHSGVQSKVDDGLRPTQDEILKMRSFMLMFVKELVLKGRGVLEEELQSILNYLSLIHEDANLVDVLELLVHLMAQIPASMVPAFDKKNGVRVVFKLLASQNEDIRMMALRLLGFFLMRSTFKRRQDAMTPHNLFSLLGERLMLHTQTISLSYYYALFEILIARVSLENVRGRRPELKPTFNLENPAILKVIATMIIQSKPTSEVMEVKKMFLADLTVLCSNKENRRTLLQMSVWQDWLFSLSYIYPSNPEQQEIADTVVDLFKVLLHHAVKCELGGWRVWMDTLAILHSKVAYEDFRIHMSKTYRQFQQQRADDIIDPSERQQQPVSTISGITDGKDSPSSFRSSVKISEISDTEAAAVAANGGEEVEEFDGDNSDERSREAETRGDGDEATGSYKLKEEEEDCENMKNDEADEQKAGSEDNADEKTVGSEDNTDEKKAGSEDNADEKKAGSEDNTDEKKAGSEDNADEKKAGSDDNADEKKAGSEDNADEKKTGSKDNADEKKAGSEDNADEKKAGSEDNADEKKGKTSSEDLQNIADDGGNEINEENDESDQTTEGGATEKTLGDPQEEEEEEKPSKEHPVSSPSADEAKLETTARIPSLADGYDASLSESVEGDVNQSRPTKSTQHADKRARGLPSLQRNASRASRGGDGLNPNQRAPNFHIPEFRWSFLHQKLLSDLLFAVEADIQDWKSQSTKNVADFVNASENRVYVVNSIHVISQLADSLVVACGGLLPLLAAATSQKREPDNLEPNQGFSLEQAVILLGRIMSLIDSLVFSGSANLAQLEADKNMPAGGILRQSLRLVCTSAVRNCLERQLPIQTDNPSQHPTAVTNKPAGGTDLKQVSAVVSMHSVQNALDNPSGQIDSERLLRDVDIHRLRTVVYRDVEEMRHAQFLALAVVYFCSVLMVSKYRDILEPPSRPSSSATSRSNKESTAEAASASKNASSEGTAPTSELQNSKQGKDLQDPQNEENQLSQQSHLEERMKSDEAEDEDQAHSTVSTTEDPGPSSLVSSAGTGIDETDGLSDGETETSEEDRIQKNMGEGRNQGRAQGTNEPSHDEADMVDVDLKDDAETFKPAQDMRAAEKRSEKAEGQESSESYKPISSITVSHKGEANQSGVGDIELSPSGLELNINPPMYSLAMAKAYCENLTEKLERTLGSLAPLLKDVFVDFASFLSKTLTGSHGQDLLIGGGGLVTMKQSTSVVELVMLLCSQEWQSSLQKHAGLAFVELVSEGRLQAHTTIDHIVRVANEAEFILNRLRAEDVQKHADFESVCAQFVFERREEEKLRDHLIQAARRHDHSVAVKQRDKILDVLSSKYGAWSADKDQLDNGSLRLDVWEDDSRRRRRMVKDSFVSSQLKVATDADPEQDADEDTINTAQENLLAQLASLKKPQREKPYFKDDELVMEEKDVEQEFSGLVSLTTPCKLIAPGVAVKGSLSITKSEIYFEMDEEDPENRKIEPKVLSYVGFRHSKWDFSDVRAVFARRYLTQNVALEIFLANRTAAMFAFPDHVTVMKVVNALPKVGVGVKYGVKQGRRVSLASGKQLFKMSNMTLKWQKKEISNFDYIMFLNNIAGRTYNDLGQYPVFPWVLVNYDTEVLDLSSASSYRDLSKPVGALSETRRSFFEKRFEAWDHDQIHPFHYETHYSTAPSTLNWLLRVEPFTTIFRSMNNNHFNHPSKIFTSIAQAWKSCQQDTSDVRELIPELFYLPEMFGNGQESSLRIKGGRTMINDVELPPWAKSPEDFVRINNMALESEFVSSQIHNWIDLIFGYKQKGPEAVRTTNVFHYLAYEGSFDLEAVTDPVMKQNIEKFVHNFGQTPSQLLTEPHQPRNTVMHLSPVIFPKTQDDICQVMKFLSNSPIVHVAANTYPSAQVPSITAVFANHAYAINKWNSSYTSGKTDPTAQPILLTMDQLLTSSPGHQRRSLGSSFDQRLPVSHHSFVTTSDNRFLFASGFWDNSFRVYLLDTAHTVQVVFGHFDVVTCVARSENIMEQDCYVLTGSKDCTVMVWTFSAKSQAITGENNSVDMPTPKTVLIGHESEITCISVSAELGLVVSGSQSGPCLVHSLTGNLLHLLEPPAICQSPRLITISREAFAVIIYDLGNICMFSINGKMLNFMKHSDHLQSVILSRDGQFMLVSGSEGIVQAWRLHDFSLIYYFSPCDNPVRSLALTHDQRFLIAGLATGCLVVFNINFNKWCPDFQEKYN